MHHVVGVLSAIRRAAGAVEFSFLCEPQRPLRFSVIFSLVSLSPIFLAPPRRHSTPIFAIQPRFSTL
jgi:hypothetical protein